MTNIAYKKLLIIGICALALGGCSDPASTLGHMAKDFCNGSPACSHPPPGYTPNTPPR